MIAICFSLLCRNFGFLLSSTTNCCYLKNSIFLSQFFCPLSRFPVVMAFWDVPAFGSFWLFSCSIRLLGTAILGYPNSTVYKNIIGAACNHASCITFCSKTWTWLLILLNLAELEIDSIQVDSYMNWQINIDLCGPRQVPKVCPLPSPPWFSLYTSITKFCNFIEDIYIIFKHVIENYLFLGWNNLIYLGIIGIIWKATWNNCPKNLATLGVLM